MAVVCVCVWGHSSKNISLLREKDDPDEKYISGGADVLLMHRYGQVC